jgi:quercetin dioxygenase-like cupin family protein
MEETFNESTNNRPQGDRPIDSPLLLISLPTLIQQLKSEDAWTKKDRNAITVFKTDGISIVLVAMHAYAEMPTHSTDGILNVNVLEGRLKFNTPDESIEIKKGELLTLHSGIPHSLLAMEESAFILTVVQ